MNYWYCELETRRGSLHQRGTRAAHETIQPVKRAEMGRYDHLLHTVSKELAAKAAENGCDVIASENPTGTRERMPNGKQFHVWAFRRLFEYVEDKTEAVGISMELPRTRASGV